MPDGCLAGRFFFEGIYRGKPFVNFLLTFQKDQSNKLNKSGLESFYFCLDILTCIYISLYIYIYMYIHDMEAKNLGRMNPIQQGLGCGIQRLESQELSRLEIEIFHAAIMSLSSNLNTRCKERCLPAG